jgi:hypothetical protein
MKGVNANLSAFFYIFVVKHLPSFARSQLKLFCLLQSKPLPVIINTVNNMHVKHVVLNASRGKILIFCRNDTDGNIFDIEKFSNRLSLVLMTMAETACWDLAYMLKIFGLENRM